MSLSLIDSASFVRGFSPSPSFEVSLVIKSTNCCPVNPATESRGLFLSGSLAKTVGLGTLLSGSACCCSFLNGNVGGTCFGGSTGGTTGGAADPAGVVANSFCNLSLASSPTSEMLEVGLEVSPALA